MKKLHRLLCVLPILGASAYAQEKPINIEVEAQAVGTTNDVVPFWMRSNQYGSIPSAGASGSLIGRINKDYDRERPKKFDWGFGFEGRGNAGKDSRFILIEGYAKAKAGIFQLKAGRTKDVMGLNGDTTLSSGNFAVSGNALGIPKIEISIPEYWRVPIFDGLFSIKGNFSHGWLGSFQVLDTIGTITKPIQKFATVDRYPSTFLHQKSLYVKLGKPGWKLSLIGGLNHQVVWGNERAVYGDKYDLSNLKTLFYVATGKTYGNEVVPNSKIGNQLGSIDLGVEYNFENFKLSIYRQNFYDVGALAKLANIADGLNGVSLLNKKYSEDNSEIFGWKNILFELFYSKNQAGYPWSKPTKSGDEDYYNNFYYLKGWSYFAQGLGNPFITPAHQARQGQASLSRKYFINNRVVAFHVGFSGHLLKWQLKSKISMSRNYGTFATSNYGETTGDITRISEYIFKPVNQLSILIRGARNLTQQDKIGFSIALDRGMLLENSAGLSLTYTRSFKL